MATILAIAATWLVFWVVALIVILYRVYRLRRRPVPPPPINLDEARREQLRSLAAAEYHQRKKGGA